MGIGFPESRAYTCLALLNNSKIGIEVTEEVVNLSDRRCVFVTQSQIEHPSRFDAPVILDEPGVMHPFHCAVPVADVDNSFLRRSGEEVFERARYWIVVRICTVGEPRRLSAAKENESAPEILCDLIGLDVRDLPAEFERVLAPQIRDTVLKIVIRAGAGKT